MRQRYTVVILIKAFHFILLYGALKKGVSKLPSYILECRSCWLERNIQKELRYGLIPPCHVVNKPIFELQTCEAVKFKYSALCSDRITFAEAEIAPI